MPRRARIKSPFDIYHVMVRGINKQNIFDEAKDYIKFLDVLGEQKELTGLELHAYCLMSNHVHLLVKENETDLSTSMKRLSGKYALWFNKKYGRVGHLFQDRYRSEPIDSEKYYLAVLRYIHMNPVDAGICKAPEEYPYSSYRNYFENNLIDAKLIEKIISKEDFIGLHLSPGDSSLKIMDCENQCARVGDMEAARIMSDICMCKSPAEFQRLSSEMKDFTITKLIMMNMNISQISRITGESPYMVRKYL